MTITKSTSSDMNILGDFSVADTNNFYYEIYFSKPSGSFESEHMYTSEGGTVTFQSVTYDTYNFYLKIWIDNHKNTTLDTITLPNTTVSAQNNKVQFPDMRTSDYASWFFVSTADDLVAAVRKISTDNTSTYSESNKAKICLLDSIAYSGFESLMTAITGKYELMQNGYELADSLHSVEISEDITGGTVTADPTSASQGRTITLTITADSGKTLESLSVMTPPGAPVDTSTSGDKTSATFTMPDDDVLVSAEFVAATAFIGSKAPTEEKAVGDIVFSDGSAEEYTSALTLTEAQKEAAVAVIFYVGSELNSGDDTTTSRTLGVGLVQNQNGLAWCDVDANAYGTDIETIQCQCPTSGSSATTITGDKNGSDNWDAVKTTLSENGTDDTSTEANYPAFYFAINYASQDGSHVSDTDYASGWYLPSIAELFQIYNCKATVDAASNLCGGSQFDSTYYWSSSQSMSNPYFAHNLSFDDGNIGNNNKFYDFYYVCAVREF
ncbi:MAG: DUF1566 domain-containing protein [Treponema sp.]|nr:DUF1566 domain-containing protein [Treponema sp.]